MRSGRSKYTLLQQIIICRSLEHTRRYLFNDSLAIIGAGSRLFEAIDVSLGDTRPIISARTRKDPGKIRTIELPHRGFTTPEEMDIATHFDNRLDFRRGISCRAFAANLPSLGGAEETSQAHRKRVLLQQNSCLNSCNRHVAVRFCHQRDGR